MQQLGAGHVAGRERRDHRHADGTRRRLAAARQGLPGRAVRGIVPLRRRVHGGRHGAVREGRRRHAWRLHADLGRRAIDRCGHRRRAGEDHEPRAADAQRRRPGALRAAASGAERGGSRPAAAVVGGRGGRAGRGRPRSRRSFRVRLDVRGAAGSRPQGRRLEPRRSARRRGRLPLERQRPRQCGRDRRHHRQLRAVALYVGGTGEARFKDLAIKDLARRITPAEQTAPRFRAQHFEDFYLRLVGRRRATSITTACST